MNLLLLSILNVQIGILRRVTFLVTTAAMTL